MSQQDKKLTGVFGHPVSDRENSMTAGPRGPLLMQDIYFLEQMSQFDREVIPERRMHAKGSGAFGTFTVTKDITKYTNAKIFSEIGKQTEMFARFSTVAGERGAADAERDIRGFALKFYTEEGNWDLVGNNTPVFFFRDPKLFVSLNRAVKRDPRTNMRDAQNNWDFWTGLPEALHRDLFEAIEKGDYPKWTMYIQVMTEEQAKNHKDNPFDLTKVWYHDEYPLIEVGEFELNRNPDNYFMDVEQAAFAPTNIIPGLDFSPDKMLQGRLFSYGDAQRYRLGVNHWQIPVNQPKGVGIENICPFSRDGQMRVVDNNQGGGTHYYPNNHGKFDSQPEYKKPPFPTDGYGYEYNQRQDDDNYFEQPGKLFRLQSEDAKERIFTNTANAMEGVTDDVKRRHIRHCYKADPEYGKGVAKALGIDINSIDLETENDETYENFEK
ncbi:Catalase [Staphylococcus aureus]|uniref:catalase n=1 Tax=Staphylococcus aureus TaxID=1280 RepID=UPI0007699630|nr:catalase [Staphylococcus aureus]CXP80381.1 Catalase [Staphylococcus aureus]